MGRAVEYWRQFGRLKIDVHIGVDVTCHRAMEFPDCTPDSYTSATARASRGLMCLVFLIAVAAFTQGCARPVSEDEPPENALPWIAVAENLAYIQSLPASLADANTRAHEYWDTGIARLMEAGNQVMSDFLMTTVVRTAAFYPEGHFGTEGLEVHLDAYLKERREYHEGALIEEGIGGTGLGLMIGGAVNDDLEAMVARQVAELSKGSSDLEFAIWEAQWIQVE
jgi:hypothetical protein